MERIKNRYIVLLEKVTKPTLKKMQDDFQMSITSSESLNKDNKSYNILNKDNSILYKNLNVMVMQDAELKYLNRALKDKMNPVIYFEKDREFFPCDELDLLNAIKNLSNTLQEKIIELDNLFRNKPVQVRQSSLMEWGLLAIGLNNTQYTGKGIDICILDTGFNLQHPDYSNRNIEGKSFIPNEDWSTDGNGHGTHCAGIAAGNKRLDTGKRYGVASESNIKIGKVLSDSGVGSTSAIIDAIDWAITKKYRIISLSLGSPVEINEEPSLIFEKVGEKALENNCLIIAAAGNDSNRPSLPKPVSCPANSKSIMAVAAIDEQLKVARFSNGGINASTGGNINVCAPGVNILSSYSNTSKRPSLYAILSGTSMATPHVSGMAALYMEAYPDLSARGIWSLLEKNTKFIENSQIRDLGSGLIRTI
jgi:subtilisin family serine protease